MKNLKLLMLLLVAVSIGFTGCKNNDDEPETKTADGTIKTPSGKSCLISKIKYDSEHEVIEYDSQNRPVKISYFDGTTLEGYETISYSSSQIVVKNYDDGQLEETITFIVSNGVVTGQTETYTRTDNGVTYTTVTQRTFEHNAEGFLTKMISNETTTSNPASATQSYKTTTVYTYQNGNLTSEVSTYIENGTNNTETRTSTYEYYTDKMNTLPFDEEDFLLTKPNKNPVKKKTESHSQQGSSTYISNYTYTYNSDGLITKKVDVNTSSNPGSTPSTDETIFEYNCK